MQDIAIWHEWLGRSADEIAADHELTLADVYAALAYYYDHREEIDAMIKKSEAFVDAFRQKISSKSPTTNDTGTKCMTRFGREIVSPTAKNKLSFWWNYGTV